MDVIALASSLRDIDSNVLLDRFGELVQRDHRETAEMLCYIAEIDERQLWAEQGYPSMFQFLVGRFHMSEPMVAKRIQAARTMQRFALVGEMVARGEIHLTGVSQLAKHLTEDNHREVLARARHRSTRDIEKLVAEIRPQPDAPSQVRKAPQRKSKTAPPEETPKQTERHPSGSLFDNGPSPRPEPLSPQRYKIQMTVGEPTHDKLEEAQALLSHRVSSGDVAIIFDQALDALLEKLRKERAAATSRPSSSPHRKPGARNRHVPAHVRQAVWERDGARCAYVSPDGRRCTETRWLELHHREPYARGGGHTAENIELRCRPHNQYEANRDYGSRFMERKRRGSQVREPFCCYRSRLSRRKTLNHPAGGVSAPFAHSPEKHPM
ncbi:MAG: HNH endonuclease [Polyangiales bacterium]